MNDADKIDLSVTDANNIDWDKHTLVVQCDKCNNPVNLDDDGVIVTYDNEQYVTASTLIQFATRSFLPEFAGPLPAGINQW